MTNNKILSRMIDHVLGSLQQDTANPAYWTRAEILDLLWEGLVELQLLTAYLQTTVTLTLSGNSLMRVPPQIGTRSVDINGRSLEKYGIDDLDSRFPTWESDPTSPRAGAYVTVGLTSLIIHPRPNAAATASVVMITMPDYFTESTILDLDEEYTEALTDYAFHVARLKEGGAEFEQSMQDYQRFNEKAAALAERADWKNAPGWSYAPKSKPAAAAPRRAK